MKTLLLTLIAATTLAACAGTCERPADHSPVMPCENCRWNEN